MLVVIDIVGRDLENFDYTMDKKAIQNSANKKVYFSIDYYSLDSMQSPTNKLKMTAGGPHYLMFML